MIASNKCRRNGAKGQHHIGSLTLPSGDCSHMLHYLSMCCGNVIVPAWPGLMETCRREAKQVDIWYSTCAYTPPPHRYIDTYITT